MEYSAQRTLIHSHAVTQSFGSSAPQAASSPAQPSGSESGKISSSVCVLYANTDHGSSASLNHSAPAVYANVHVPAQYYNVDEDAADLIIAEIPDKSVPKLVSVTSHQVSAQPLGPSCPASISSTVNQLLPFDPTQRPPLDWLVFCPRSTPSASHLVRCRELSVQYPKCSVCAKMICSSSGWTCDLHLDVLLCEACATNKNQPGGDWRVLMSTMLDMLDKEYIHCLPPYARLFWLDAIYFPQELFYEGNVYHLLSGQVPLGIASATANILTVGAVASSTRIGLTWDGLLGSVQRIYGLTSEGQRAWLPFCLECFAYLTATAGLDINLGINRPQWIQLCAWFGPANNAAFWLRIAWLCTQKWFFGNLAAEKAMKLASKHSKSPGSWLLRFSSSEQGGFAFTVAEFHNVRHYRVSRDWGTAGEGSGDYLLRVRSDGEPHRYTNFAALLEGARKELQLGAPLLGQSVGHDAIIACMSQRYRPQALLRSRDAAVLYLDSQL